MILLDVFKKYSNFKFSVYTFYFSRIFKWLKLSSDPIIQAENHVSSIYLKTVMRDI